MAHSQVSWLRCTVRIFSVALVLAGSPLRAVAENAGIQGIWITDDGLAAVRFAPCGSSVCGHVVWLRNPTSPSHQSLVDRNNQDPALRTRAICGLKVLGDLKRKADGSWDEGWVYDPKVGRTYDVALSLKDQTTLMVFGYLKTKLLGQTHYWTRAAPNLMRCE